MATKIIKVPGLIFEEFDPGDRVFLVSWFNELEGGTNYRLHRETPVTNRGEERENGWLGCTNNINKSAHGLHEIESMEIISRTAVDGYPEDIGVRFELTEVAV